MIEIQQTTNAGMLFDFISLLFYYYFTQSSSRYGVINFREQQAKRWRRTSSSFHFLCAWKTISLEFMLTEICKLISLSLFLTVLYLHDSRQKGNFLFGIFHPSVLDFSRRYFARFLRDTWRRRVRKVVNYYSSRLFVNRSEHFSYYANLRNA